MTGTGFFDSLEAQLDSGLERTAARRAARRRLMQRATAVTLGLVLVVVAVMMVRGDDRAAAGVDVEQRGGLVYVRLTDVEYRADVIEDAAREAGLDIAVEAVPAGPSLVGRFLRYNETDQVVGELRELDRDGPAFSGFSIPAGYDGHLVLQVGRPAKDGEGYGLFPNALAEGEPLACSGILGASPAKAADIAASRDLDVGWTLVGEQGARSIDEADVRSRELAATRVRRVLSTGPDVVLVWLGTESVPLPALDLTADATC